MSKWWDKISALFKKPSAKPAEALSQPAVEPQRPVLVETAIKSQRPTVDIVIGLDFGTSCSKVVLSDRVLDEFYAVEFQPAAPGIDRFLLPTRVWESNGNFSLARSESGSWHSNLKLNLIDALRAGGDCKAAKAHLVAYVALTLQQTFQWFESRYGTEYRTKEICWWLNIGFPEKSATSGTLADVYKACGAAAGVLATEGGSITIERVQAVLDGFHHRESKLPADRIALYPEIAAQLAGYVNSPYRCPGPLLLIDVGAGTLDVSTIILHSAEGENVCSFHFCEVAHLGAYRLFEQRMQALAALSPNSVNGADLREHDPSKPIPEKFTDYLSSPLAAPELRRAFNNVSASFAERCRDICLSNIVHFRNCLRRTHNRPGYDPFPRHLNYILSGGGSRLQFYADVLGEKLETRLVQFTTWMPEAHRRRSLSQGMKRIHFPMPHRFQARGLKTSDFDRLSVAHGLSLGQENLMRIMNAR